MVEDGLEKGDGEGRGGTKRRGGEAKEGAKSQGEGRMRRPGWDVTEGDAAVGKGKVEWRGREAGAVFWRGGVRWWCGGGAGWEAMHGCVEGVGVPGFLELLCFPGFL